MNHLRLASPLLCSLLLKLSNPTALALPPFAGPQAQACAAEHTVWPWTPPIAAADAGGGAATIPKGLGLFESNSDVGPVKKAGEASYDAASQTYHMAGSGKNMWAEEDEFHFLWKKMSGNFILSATAGFVGKGTDPHRKIGWMIRADLSTDSPYVDVALHGDGLTSMQYRRTRGADTAEVKSGVTGPTALQLERRDGKFIMSVAKPDDPYTTAELADLQLADEVYVGLFVCAHNADVIERARFENVRITVPAPAGYRPYRDYIGSRLEVLTVDTGQRLVLHTVPDSLQAPNWTHDGRALIYNRNGRLYRFDLETKVPTQIAAGSADRINADHVISHDGRTLAFSHHSADHNGFSLGYTMPIGGGKPTLIISEGPSYIHGWSPDGEWLTYTAGRNGNYDIYKARSDGTAPEVRLTTSPYLDDGSEFTPDGQRIYYSSARSGRMQIWRMKPDGSEQEQVTDDTFNNWFPHISPDGNRMVVLSYDASIKPEDHPWYQPVYLRLLPIEGGPARVIARLYGGQGTINVPSWSPDGKRIAFVSNTVIRDN